MNKLSIAIVPACITFGPLFMTEAGGRSGLVLTGVFMLIAGLGVMFRIILDQQKLIEKLQAERSTE